MTTVAYKDGELAADSRETFGKRIDSNRFKKIFRLPDGSVMGGAGGAAALQALRDDLVAAIASTKPGKTIVLPNRVKGVAAILVDVNLNTYYYERQCWSEFDYPYAVGSGSDYALAAMDAGATAAEAVKIAIGRDVHSGGRVTVLKPKKKRK